MTEPTNLPDDRIETALRQELSGIWVPFDPDRAEAMISTATSADIRRLPRLAAPLTAAAAVLAVGAGVAVFAANGAGDTASPSGGGPVPSRTASAPLPPGYGVLVCADYGRVQPAPRVTVAPAHPKPRRYLPPPPTAVTLSPPRAARAEARNRERAARAQERNQLNQVRVNHHVIRASVGSAPSAPVPTLSPPGSKATCGTGGSAHATCYTRLPGMRAHRLHFVCPPGLLPRVVPAPPSAPSPTCTPTAAPQSTVCVEPLPLSVSPTRQSR